MFSNFIASIAPAAPFIPSDSYQPYGMLRPHERSSATLHTRSMRSQMSTPADRSANNSAPNSKQIQSSGNGGAVRTGRKRAAEVPSLRSSGRAKRPKSGIARAMEVQIESRPRPGKLRRGKITAESYSVQENSSPHSNLEVGLTAQGTPAAAIEKRERFHASAPLMGAAAKEPGISVRSPAPSPSPRRAVTRKFLADYQSFLSRVADKRRPGNAGGFRLQDWPVESDHSSTSDSASASSLLPAASISSVTTPEPGEDTDTHGLDQPTSGKEISRINKLLHGSFDSPLPLGLSPRVSHQLSAVSVSSKALPDPVSESQVDGAVSIRNNSGGVGDGVPTRQSARNLPELLKKGVDDTLFRKVSRKKSTEVVTRQVEATMKYLIDDALKNGRPVEGESYFKKKEENIQKRLEDMVKSLAVICESGNLIRYNTWNKHKRPRFKGRPVLSEHGEAEAEAVARQKGKNVPKKPYKFPPGRSNPASRKASRFVLKSGDGNNAPAQAESDPSSTMTEDGRNQRQVEVRIVPPEPSEEKAHTAQPFPEQRASLLSEMPDVPGDTSVALSKGSGDIPARRNNRRRELDEISYDCHEHPNVNPGAGGSGERPAIDLRSDRPDYEKPITDVSLNRRRTLSIGMTSPGDELPRSGNTQDVCSAVFDAFVKARLPDFIGTCDAACIQLGLSGFSADELKQRKLDSEEVANAFLEHSPEFFCGLELQEHMVREALVHWLHTDIMDARSRRTRRSNSPAKNSVGPFLGSTSPTDAEESLSNMPNANPGPMQGDVFAQTKKSVGLPTPASDTPVDPTPPFKSNKRLGKGNKPITVQDFTKESCMEEMRLTWKRDAWRSERPLGFVAAARTDPAARRVLDLEKEEKAIIDKLAAFQNTRTLQMALLSPEDRDEEEIYQLEVQLKERLKVVVAERDEQLLLLKVSEEPPQVEPLEFVRSMIPWAKAVYDPPRPTKRRARKKMHW